MIIYTNFSESHKDMYDRYFLPSLRNIYSKNEVKVKALFHKQLSPTGDFMSPGFLDTMDIKIDLILQALAESDKFIFADCDVQFFKPFIKDIETQLNEYDLVAQEDRGSICAGFFGCNSNIKTVNLFKEIKSNFRYMVNDQEALNRLKHKVKYKLLDKEQYYTIGNFFKNSNGTFVWDNITNIIPPRNILIHHANYVIGTSNKIKLLDMVKSNIKI
jgi:hypothetical protein